MINSALNILPWREIKMRHQLYHDSMVGLLLLGFCAVWLELGLLLVACYNDYLIHQQPALLQPQQKQKLQFEAAQQLQIKITQLKSQLTKQKQQQIFWQNISNTFSAIAKSKPDIIQLTKIQCEKKVCLIDGHAEMLKEVESYQKNLQGLNLQVILNRWQPKVPYAHFTNFQLSLNV